MTKVTVQEVIEALNLLVYVADENNNATSAQIVRQRLAERIRTHGIAPPEGYAIVPTQDPAAFTEWLCREMPAGTIIGDAKWWAKRIASRFIQQAAAPKQENSNE